METNTDKEIPLAPTDPIADGIVVPQEPEDKVEESK